MTITVLSNDAAADAQVNKPAESLVSESKEKNQSEPVADEAAEQTDPLVSDAEEGAEEEESDESEAEDSETETETAASDDADKPRKKSGSQRRKERAERAEAENERLQGIIEQMALKGAGDSKTTPKVESPKADASKPDPSKFESHAEYVEALTDWKLDVRDQKKLAEKLQDDFQKVVKSHADRIEAFKKKTPDFEEKMDGLKAVPNSPTVRDIITTSENGPEILYELAKDPKEAKRIALLSPLNAAREIGKIESRLAAKSSPETQTKKLTNAPKPLEPVGTGKSASKKTIFDPDLSQAEFERLERERMKKRRQA